MELLTRERGQALLLMAVLLGVAALAAVGLRDAQERLVDGVRDQLAAEAAAEAAGAVVADLLIGGADPRRLVADPAARAAAQVAADEMSALHGRSAPTDLRVEVVSAGVEVELRLAGRVQRVAVPW